MSRYRKSFGRDEPQISKGDPGFLYIDQATKPEILPQGVARDAQNNRMLKGDGVPRGGTITPKFANAIAYGGRLYGAGKYSNPNDSDSEWILKAVVDGVWVEREGRYPQKIALAGGLTITDEVFFSQAFDKILMGRGEVQNWLQWDGSFTSSFEEVVQTGSGSTATIPNSSFGIIFGSRFLVIGGDDHIDVSDLLNYTRYVPTIADFRINSGTDDVLTSIFPYAERTVLPMKDQSIFAVINIYGDLSAMLLQEVTRDAGSIARDGVLKSGSQVHFLTNGVGICAVEPDPDKSGRFRLVQTPISYTIPDIVKRINWKYAYQAQVAKLGDYEYWAVPIDSSTYNNAVIVRNSAKEQFESLDVWNSESGIRLDRFIITDYLGKKRLFAIDLINARTHVMYEGMVDVIGDTEYQIEHFVFTRDYTLDELGFSRVNQASVQLESLNPRTTITAYTEGVNEAIPLMTNRTRDRTKYDIHAKPAYDLSNVNEDHGAPKRQDYAVFADDEGFYVTEGIDPELKQERSEPLPARIFSKRCSFKIGNNQGYNAVKSVTIEGAPLKQERRTAD